MTKTKIAIFVVLIFLAGAVTGDRFRSVWRPSHMPPPPRNREDFANHIFNRIKERLELTPDQVEKVEPVFRKGFEEFREIQDRSMKEVQAAMKRNHDEMAKLLTPEQQQKLEQMDREQRDRHGKRPPGGRPGPFPGKPGPGPAPEPDAKPALVPPGEPASAKGATNPTESAPRP